MKFLGRTMMRSMGKYPRECNLCGHKGKFLGYGYPYICDILCPKCGTLERHRLLALANQQHDFFRDREVLHFAPETAIRDLVMKHQPRTYVTADLFASGIDRKENIESLTLPDSCFDLVICLHVLEHVNDQKAASELFRVLRLGGTLLAMFPIVEGWDATYEDTACKTPQERLLHFGQHDHVRYFGRDVRQRIAAAGFIVDEYTAVEPNVSRYGLSRGEKVFICKRPEAHQAVSVDHAAMAGHPSPDAAGYVHSAR